MRRRDEAGVEDEGGERVERQLAARDERGAEPEGRAQEGRVERARHHARDAVPRALPVLQAEQRADLAAVAAALVLLRAIGADRLDEGEALQRDRTRIGERVLLRVGDLPRDSPYHGREGGASEDPDGKHRGERPVEAPHKGHAADGLDDLAEDDVDVQREHVAQLDHVRREPRPELARRALVVEGLRLGQHRRIQGLAQPRDEARAQDPKDEAAKAGCDRSEDADDGEAGRSRRASARRSARGWRGGRERRRGHLARSREEQRDEGHGDEWQVWLGEPPQRDPVVKIGLAGRALLVLGRPLQHHRVVGCSRDDSAGDGGTPTVGAAAENGGERRANAREGEDAREERRIRPL